MKKIDFENQADFNYVLPPKDGETIVNQYGAVLMNLKTFNEYQDIAVNEAIRLGRFVKEQEHE